MLIGEAECLLQRPGNRRDKAGRWKDSVNPGTSFKAIVLPREGIHLGVLFSWKVSDFEIKLGKEHHPPGLAWVEPLNFVQILKLAMICKKLEGVKCCHSSNASLIVSSSRSPTL